jgi:hypothetical protein
MRSAAQKKNIVTISLRRTAEEMHVTFDELFRPRWDSAAI